MAICTYVGEYNYYFLIITYKIKRSLNMRKFDNKHISVNSPLRCMIWKGKSWMGIAFQFKLRIQGAQESLLKSVMGKQSDGRALQFNLLLLGGRESPLSTSEILEPSYLLLDDEVERETLESISTAVSIV